MTLILIEFGIVLAGLALTAILFYRIPVLPKISKDIPDCPAVSIIIPVRNEEKNLPLLLADLKDQTLPVYEVICVDDSSEDSTARIALENGAKLISLDSKPVGWTGKTWACQNGADAAKGELLLFLDADVRLGPDAIYTLIQVYTYKRCTISVQPYHRTKKLHEQFSMMFNFVQIAANGTALPKPLNIGLYGPVILISQQDYMKAGGHRIAKTSVVEDMTLGMQLKKMELPFRLFIGNKDISFRMYGDRFSSLLEGWVKNIATGAAKIPVSVFVMVFLWIASLISVPLHLIIFTVSLQLPWLIVYGLLYMVWICVIACLAQRIGRFQLWAFLLYPLLVLVLLGVFLVSGYKKLFVLKVTWKGRTVETGEKACD